MRNSLKVLVAIACAGSAFAFSFGEIVSTAESDEFFVDSRTRAPQTLRSADHYVDIAYSGYNWDTKGSVGQKAQVTVNGSLTIVNDMGEGLARWKPKAVGAYELKHVCNGATQSVKFDVQGPSVSVFRQKDASNRETFYFEIACDTPGSVVYYTIDGSEPTKESAVYVGPFFLDPNREFVVKAMAVVETGLQSCPVIASFPALSMETVASASSEEFKVDGRAGTGEDLPSEGVETLTYSSRWNNEEAQYLIIDLSGGPTAERYPVSFLSEAPGCGGWTEEYKTSKLVLRKISAGSFTMGSDRDFDNKPHQVTVDNPFYCGVFEVTQRQYELVMGTNPSKYKGNARAVECVSYGMIRGEFVGANWPISSEVDESSFLCKIRARTTLVSLDLPTEEMWEYACRAGTTSDFNNGGSDEEDLKTLGRYSGNQDDGRGGFLEGATVVGSYNPNAWGLYDMHGNVYEWCLDRYGEDAYRVMRGGSWNLGVGYCRSSDRSTRAGMSVVGGDIGFRLVCSAKQDTNEKAAIAQDGVVLFSDLTGEGMKEWTAPRNGRYELTHTTYTNGVKGKVETAVFEVEGIEVPVSELTIDWGESSFVYDGQPKEPVITVKDRETTLTKGTHYLVEYKDNINVGTAKAIVKGVDPYVGEVTNEFAITAAPINVDPGPIPVGGLSKFDATYVYDGEGHTINTQALYAVTLVGSTPSFSFSLDGETGWQNDPFVYTNVGEYVMWYRISAPNYADYKHQAKVTIQPLVLTVTFDANGGSCPMASKTVTHGATYGTLPTPTWAGHIFAGWYTAASGGNEVEDSTVVSIMAPQMLYAHWVSVTGVSAKQRYPWNGLVDIVVAFEGESSDVAKVDCSFIATNSATKAALSVASITRKGADAGKDNAWSRRFVWNAGSDVGAVKIDDVALTVVANIPLGGVQLWENGPYWAECNVGATKPEESGYYFWWGDTVGYSVNTNGATWKDDSKWEGGGYWDGVKWISSAGVQMSRSPFDSSTCPTEDKTISELQTAKYIDSMGNLVTAHDAATAHLGSPWRMPTNADFVDLDSKCDTVWTTHNGVYGKIVTGRGAYSSKSIFLPTAGCGPRSELYGSGSVGHYWSSTPSSRDSGLALQLYFSSSSFSTWDNHGRYIGQSVRPVRGFSETSAPGPAIVTHLSLDCRTGDRVSAGTEELTFSNLWDGEKEATVTIAQDGAAIFTGLTGEGVKTWTVDRNGRYELTHTTCNNGAAGKVETAVFVVEGKEVPVSELTIDWGQSSFVYDGQPKEPVITVKDRGTTLTKGTHYLVEYKDNVNVGTAKAIVTGIEPYVGEVANAFTITKATIPGGGEEPGTGTIPEGGLSKFDRTGVYNGKGQTIDVEKLEEAFAEVVGDEFTISFANCESGGQGLSALPPTEGWGDVAPTITDIGELVLWYKVMSSNYEDYVHQAKVTVVEKVITDEMVQPGEDAFFFDGDDKKPTVDVVYEVDGKDICTENDYTLTYGTKAAAGWWVTVTGKGNYSGTVTKIVPVLKRPVAPPIVPSRSYNGKAQKPTIPTDSRWTVVANPGGVEVGEYTNVVLRLTNTTDYKWKGGTEDQTDITLVFKVTKGNNGWSRQPGMKGWAYGETPSEPAMGQARYGTVRVAYRKAGADVSTETATRPELPGQYVARFYVEATDNFIGVTRDIAFEITGTAPGGDHTTTTPVPVPYKWLEPYLKQFGGDYESAAKATGANGVALWESYVAGLDPTDPTSRFTASIAIGTDGKPIITWKPALNGETAEGEGILKGERIYRICGKKDLSDATWTADIDPKGGVYRFYKITVELVK